MDEKHIIVYIDGSISGKIALCIDDKEPFIEDVSLDPLYVEYIALKKALKLLPENSKSTIYSDSQALVARMNSDHEVPNIAVQREHNQVIQIMNEKNLDVKIKWVQRSLNKAGHEL